MSHPERYHDPHPYGQWLDECARYQRRANRRRIVERESGLRLPSMLAGLLSALFIIAINLSH